MKYEDDDEEEFDEEDIRKIPKEHIDTSQLLNCGYVGAIVWKLFEMDGTVEQCLIGEIVILFLDPVPDEQCISSQSPYSFVVAIYFTFRLWQANILV